MLNDKLFVIGGEIDGKSTEAMEIYDFKTSLWSKGPDLLGARDRLSAIALNDCIYICGGHDGESYLSSVQCFNPESNMWRNVSNLLLKFCKDFS